MLLCFQLTMPTICCIWSNPVALRMNGIESFLMVLAGYVSAPGMPPMMAPPGAPSAPGQLNGFPRPPAVMNPTAVSGSAAPPASSSGAPSMATPQTYQANPTVPTSGNVNAQAPEMNH